MGHSVYPDVCKCGNKYFKHRREREVLLYCGACGNERTIEAPQWRPSIVIEPAQPKRKKKRRKTSKDTRSFVNHR